MPYYGAGDYYQGDYYQGDFLGIGKALQKVGSFAYNAIVPAPVRTAVSAVRAAVRGPNRLPGVGLVHNISDTPLVANVTAQLEDAGAMVNTGIPNLGPGVSLTPSGMLVPCQLPGHRLNKSGYYRHPRGNPAAAVYVPAKSVCVKTRRMNVTNARALRKAIRRVSGFGKIVKRMKRAVSRANSAVGNVHRSSRKKR